MKDITSEDYVLRKYVSEYDTSFKVYFQALKDYQNGNGTKESVNKALNEYNSCKYSLLLYAFKCMVDIKNKKEENIEQSDRTV